MESCFNSQKTRPKSYRYHRWRKIFASIFGVLFPNTNQEASKLIWQDHVFSVNDIEEYTGYNFFSNIPTEVQEKIENQIDLPDFFKK